MTHIGHGILAIYDKCTNLVSGTSQRRMQNRTILCCIDMLSAIHIGTALFKTHLTGKLTQQLKGLLVNKILREIYLKLVKRKRQARSARRVLCKPRA